MICLKSIIYSPLLWLYPTLEPSHVPASSCGGFWLDIYRVSHLPLGVLTHF